MKRRILAAAVFTTSLTLTATPAFAAWIAGNLNGSATVAATTMPSGSGTPTGRTTPADNSSTVRISFTPVQFKGTALGSYTGGAYKVARYVAAAPGTAAQAVTTCSASPCDVTDVPDGTWYFDVTPALQNWRGRATARTSSVTVDTTAPTGLTVTASVTNNSKTLTLSGSAGKAATDAQSVNVVVCLTNSATCAPADTFYSGTASVTSAGTWTVSPATNLKQNKTYFVRVTQSDTAGNVATATTSFSV